MHMIEILLLAASSCIDAMGATVSYRVSGIRFPIASVLVMTFVHGMGMAFALFFADAVLPFSTETCIKIGAVLLICFGLMGLARAALTDDRKKRLANRFKFLSLFLDETAADKDGSRSLSCKETLPVSLAVATDAFAVGICAGPTLSDGGKIITAAVTLGVCFVLILAGRAFGKGLHRLMGGRFDLSYIQGTFLLLMGFYMLFTK